MFINTHCECVLFFAVFLLEGCLKVAVDMGDRIPRESGYKYRITSKKIRSRNL